MIHPNVLILTDLIRGTFGATDTLNADSDRSTVKLTSVGTNEMWKVVTFEGTLKFLI